VRLGCSRCGRGGGARCTLALPDRWAVCEIRGP